MPLFKHTTEITVDKTLGEIHECLRKHGASAILTDYDQQGAIVAVSFKISINGKEMGFRLPSDWRPVLAILEADPKVERRHKNKDQAMRVAWRIVAAWVTAQMAIVETRMVSIPQVFLPYATTADGRTVAEKILGDDDGMKLLT